MLFRSFAAFRERLASHQTLPAIDAVLRFLARPDIDNALSRFPAWEEAKKTCAFLSFKLGATDTIIFADPAVKALVNRMAAPTGKAQTICLVSGQQDAVAKLHPAIKGVQGTNTTGGNIVSFNFSAVWFFGKEQGANAPVGEAAAFAYTTALNTLLGRDSAQKAAGG